MKKRALMILLSTILLSECGGAGYLLFHQDMFKNSSTSQNTEIPVQTSIEDTADGNLSATLNTETVSAGTLDDNQVQVLKETGTASGDTGTSGVTSNQQKSSAKENIVDTSLSGEIGEDYFSTPEGIAFYNDQFYKQQGNYAFDNMDSRYQQLYVEILCIVQNLGKEVLVSSTSVEDIDYAFQCMLSDHPEIFYVDGYTYTTYSQSNSIVKILLSGNYTMNREEIKTAQTQIEQAVMECISGIDASASEYDKVKYIYEYLVNNTQYNISAPENQNICSVFIYKESVCQGYAKAMQYLLNRINVFCTLVVGTVENGVGHAWNLVSVDGNYYYVDVTWGDAFYVFDDSQTVSSDKVPTISYDYLCVTTQQLTATHIINNPVQVPWCVALDANYYVREKAYFVDTNAEQISALFSNAYGQGKELVTMKCSDINVYNQMVKVLIEEQGIFQYLKETENSVAYADSAEQLSLTFWLN